MRSDEDQEYFLQREHEERLAAAVAKPAARAAHLMLAALFAQQAAGTEADEKSGLS